MKNRGYIWQMLNGKELSNNRKTVVIEDVKKEGKAGVKKGAKTMVKFLAVGMAGVLLLTGCGLAAAGSDAASGGAAEAGFAEGENTVASSAYTTEGIDMDITGDYSDKAIGAKWSLEDAAVITLSDSGIIIDGDGVSEDGGIITLSEKGTYVFSGTISKGQILVDLAEDENVQIVLHGVKIANDKTAPIYIVNAKNVYITLADGTENEIVDGRVADASETSEKEDEKEELTAAIYSKTDLFINGTGTLSVTAGYKDGITSKDDLKLVDGSITVEAADDGIVGKDSVSIRQGTYNITAGGDGIKSTNTEDVSRGYIVIDGGDITIDAGSDGMDSVYALVINGGNIVVTNSQEGLECLNIVVNDGTVDITSTDDGVNISSGGSAGEVDKDVPAEKNANFTKHGGNKGGMGGMENAIDGALVIHGGTMMVNAEGDGLDSNGDIQINGGEIIVYGPAKSGNAAIDYSGICEINGGVLLVTSCGGMEQTGSEVSTQKMAQANWEEAILAGTQIEIQDESGMVLYSIKTVKECRYAAISAPELNNLMTVTFSAGSSSVSADVQ